MRFGIPDLPRTLDAVLHALPPSWLPTAWTELMTADFDDVPALLAKWHRCASSLPTPEQAREAVRLEAAGRFTPQEELLDDTAERWERWERTMAERRDLLTPEQVEQRLADTRDEQKRRRANAARFCETLEKLAAEQRRYLEACRQERERRQD